MKEESVRPINMSVRPYVCPSPPLRLAQASQWVSEAGPGLSEAVSDSGLYNYNAGSGLSEASLANSKTGSDLSEAGTSLSKADFGLQEASYCHSDACHGMVAGRTDKRTGRTDSPCMLQYFVTTHSPLPLPPLAYQRRKHTFARIWKKTRHRRTDGPTDPHIRMRGCLEKIKSL